MRRTIQDVDAQYMDYDNDTEDSGFSFGPRDQLYEQHNESFSPNEIPPSNQECLIDSTQTRRPPLSCSHLHPPHVLHPYERMSPTGQHKFLQQRMHLCAITALQSCCTRMNLSKDIEAAAHYLYLRAWQVGIYSSVTPQTTIVLMSAALYLVCEFYHVDVDSYHVWCHMTASRGTPPLAYKDDIKSLRKTAMSGLAFALSSVEWARTVYFKIKSKEKLRAKAVGRIFGQNQKLWNNRNKFNLSYQRYNITRSARPLLQIRRTWLPVQSPLLERDAEGKPMLLKNDFYIPLQQSFGGDKDMHEYHF